jgi:dTDP-4-amino-4,6-dideoxygalactose transaminase
VNYKGHSVLNWGDASTLSFHATKLFHTVEGGAIVFKNAEVLERARRMVNFGLGGAPEDIDVPGINAKMSEVHAAYGLCMLDSIDEILERRSEVLATYITGLDGVVSMPQWRDESTNNAAYAPVLLKSEAQCLEVLDQLCQIGVVARRYFYPSLNQVKEFSNSSRDECPNSVDAASRAICLPIYPDLALSDVHRIIEAVKNGCKA